MAWNKRMNGLDSLHMSMAKLPGNAGSMPPLGFELSHMTLKPIGSMGSVGSLGGKSTLGGKSIQSPAQHAAVEKAALVSASKRKKYL